MTLIIFRILLHEMYVLISSYYIHTYAHTGIYTCMCICAHTYNICLIDVYSYYLFGITIISLHINEMCELLLLM
jgi:hypothetical protein